MLNTVGIEEVIKKTTEWLGSLRDVYIFDVNFTDWNRLLYVVKKEYPLICDQSIPDSIHEIIPIREEHGFNLSVIIGDGIFANCHFYVSENEQLPIEFDLDPREFDTKTGMKDVLKFLSVLGNGLSKDVFMTHENCEEEVLIKYSFSEDCCFYISETGELREISFE